MVSIQIGSNYVTQINHIHAFLAKAMGLVI
jgi:hypothetical protein